MTGARILNFKREDAAKISFLLSIPALSGTGIYGLYALAEKNDTFLNLQSILTIFLTFIFSYLSIKYFLVYLKKFNLNLILGYRIILGLFLLSLVYL